MPSVAKNMIIAKIVSSNSHVDYAARVVDALDTETPPSADDYGFGRFVCVEPAGENIVGVIYDSRLVNPEYASFGPRLSPRPALAKFTPDYLNEQGILLGILLLGSVDAEGRVKHGVPRRIVPPGEDVATLDADEVRAFHTQQDGRLHLHYFSQAIAHAGPFAVPLLASIIEELCRDAGESDRQRLQVLKQTLAWQGTMGGMRL